MLQWEEKELRTLVNMFECYSPCIISGRPQAGYSNPQSLSLSIPKVGITLPQLEVTVRENAIKMLNIVPDRADTLFFPSGRARTRGPPWLGAQHPPCAGRV